MPDQPLVIDYYSDILCVWAWIAQRRIDELQHQLGDQIVIRHHYIDLFGDTVTRMHSGWADRGLYQGFAQHVQEAVAPFPEAPVNKAIWNDVRPTTSANAHMLIKAVRLAYGEQAAIDTALNMRQAFFVDAEDVSNLSVLYERIKTLELDIAPINEVVNSGAAIAALMNDYQQQKVLGLKGSPSYVMDNGRQTLYGNVGYRVLHANIEELLKNPSDEASWC